MSASYGLLLILLIAGLFLFWRFLCRPATILYALALAVSFIAVNINVGFTIYVSRLLLLVLVVVIIIRLSQNNNKWFCFHIDSVFIKLFAATMFVQSLALPISGYPVEHARWMFIYLSMMAVFIAVLILSSSVTIVLKSLRFYLGFGVVQGLTAVYQVVGLFQGWPMYQDFFYGSLMGEVKTGNPRNLMGVYYSGDAAMARAFGYLSDVNMFGGYLVGVILLALAFISYNRRDILAYCALFAGGVGLILSLSRSAELTLVVVGLPILIFLIRRAGFSFHWLKWPAIGIVLAVVMLLRASTFEKGDELSTIDDISRAASSRIVDLMNVESADTSDHILTRLVAIDAWMTSPLIGIGEDYGQMGWYSKTYDHDWFGAHSHHLNVLAGSGILGLTLEWTFMAVVFRYMWRGLNRSRHKSQERAVMAGLLAAYIAILLGNFLYHYYLSDFVWFLMGSGVALSRLIILKHNNSCRSAIPPLGESDRLSHGRAVVPQDAQGAGDGGSS